MTFPRSAAALPGVGLNAVVRGFFDFIFSQW